ncbi:undecaprenyldiphospho-muramoylpentapeptide beta-N-acetylglucosaminyltransferase [Bartonella sp. LJL80]
MMDKKVIVLVAGGTGGHLFPAEALAGELTKRGYDVHLATDTRAKRFVRHFAEDHIHVIPSATIKGRNPISLCKTLWQLLKGVRCSRRLFKRLKPVLVGGFGGYPTLPPLYAAQSAGIPTFIHEQNAVMGRANKAMAPRVTAIAGGFLADGGQYENKTVITGNPVREAVIKAASQPYRPSVGDAPFHLLVFGGSQGASYFSEVVPEAISHLDEKTRRRIRLVQQVRGDKVELVETYRKMNVEAEIAEFFDDMADRIARANFVMARSGASTVSEIAAIGRPALLVPYPHALDHDQAANAAKLAATGGVKVIAQHELDAQKLSEVFKVACDDSDLLMTQAAAAKSAGHVDATEKLADLAELLISSQSISILKKGETL